MPIRAGSTPVMLKSGSRSGFKVGGQGLVTFDTSNILTGDNSTFEGGVGDWVVAGNCTISSDATWAHSGTKSLKLTPTALGPSADIPNTSNKIAVVTGATYRLDAWATAAGGLTRNISLSRATFTSAHGFVGFSNDNSAGTMNATAGVWTEAHLDFTVEATCVWAQINVFSSNMSSGGTESAWFDDVSIARIA